MELHELQKMISIIHDKKPRCRGNLRVKVLLKSTHDYVRRSLIDEQLGHPENLMTLLRNSGRESMSSTASFETDVHSASTVTTDETYPAVVNADSHSMDCDQISQHSTIVTDDQEAVTSDCSSQKLKQISEQSSAINETLSENGDNYQKSTLSVSECPDRGKAFRNSNKKLNRNNDNKPKEKYSKLTKALRKVIKHWDKIMSKVKSDKTYSKRHCHRIKKMRKLLLESKACFKADFENQSFTQQQLSQTYVRVIKRMLKQCDNMLAYK